MNRLRTSTRVPTGIGSGSVAVKDPDVAPATCAPSGSSDEGLAAPPMMRPTDASGKNPRRPATTKTAGASRPAAGSSRRSGPDLAHERKLWRAGHELVAGMDEVGRGAWAGALTVGAAGMYTGRPRDS